MSGIDRSIMHISLALTQEKNLWSERNEAIECEVDKLLRENSLER